KAKQPPKSDECCALQGQSWLAPECNALFLLSLIEINDRENDVHADPAASTSPYRKPGPRLAAAREDVRRAQRDQRGDPAHEFAGRAFRESLRGCASQREFQRHGGSSTRTWNRQLESCGGSRREHRVAQAGTVLD